MAHRVVPLHVAGYRRIIGSRIEGAYRWDPGRGPGQTAKFPKDLGKEAQGKPAVKRGRRSPEAASPHRQTTIACVRETR